MKAIVAGCCLLALGVAGVAVAGDAKMTEGKAAAAPAAAQAKAAAPAGAPAAASAMDKSCGQHMAETAVLPSKMHELMTSVADMIEAHAAFMVANAKGNKDAMAEADGMKALAKDHRELATMMGKTAEHMTAAAKWPNAPHDMNKMMADPKIMDAMKRVMKNEKEMIALMQTHNAQMEQMAPKSTN